MTDTPSSFGKLLSSRYGSLLILIAIVLLIGLLFYQVIQPFILSLLFALVMGVLFRPVFTWFETRLPNHRRIAAGLTTVGILFVVLVPIIVASAIAAWQLIDLASEVVSWVNPNNESGLSDQWDSFRDSSMYQWGESQWQELNPDQQQQLREGVGKSATVVASVAYQTTQVALKNVIAFVIGFAIMVLSLYYFYADGPRLLAFAKKYSPLDEADERSLILRFEKVCRGVVLGTVASALLQAILAGIGFAIAGVPHVLLLAACTMFVSFIPFLGAVVIWLSVAVFLFADGQYFAATFVFVYGAGVVSTSDNLVKMYVIGGEAQLHPLLVLLTVLGALKLLGFLGIFIGPMVAAFLYAFLDILRSRLLEHQGKATHIHHVDSNL